MDENNAVCAIDVFVDALSLSELGFEGVNPQATGRPSYHPGVLLKLYIYGYLNRVQSSRRLEREAGRNLEVMWLTGRLAPDHKTIADFRRDNGPAIKKTCAQFVKLCRKMELLSNASVAIDGSKFKAVNSRDNNFTKGKLERRLMQIEESVARYMSQLDTADRRTAAGQSEGSSYEAAHLSWLTSASADTVVPHIRRLSPLLPEPKTAYDCVHAACRSIKNQAVMSAYSPSLLFGRFQGLPASKR